MSTKTIGHDKDPAPDPDPDPAGIKQLDEINEKLKLFDERQKLILEKIERIDEQFDAIKNLFKPGQK